MRIDPAGYGAVGDGVADDTAAVQAALNAIAPGDVVELGGHYLITGRLVVRGKSRFDILGPGLISFAATIPSINGGTAVLSVSGCSDFGISGLTVNVVTQDQMYNGIAVSASTNGLIERCKVTGARWVGIGVYDATPGTSRNITFDRNTIEYCRYGISVNGKWIRITSNHIAGYWLSSAEAANPWVNTSQHWDAIILGNGTSESVVSGNVIVEPGQSGIYAATITACTISGNAIFRPQNKGIDIGPAVNPASFIAVTGNSVIDAVRGGIHFCRVNNSTIAGNVTNSGIILNGQCLRNTIAGNTISQSTVGIFVNAVAPKSMDNTISGNGVLAPTPYAVNTTDNTLAA